MASTTTVTLFSSEYERFEVAAAAASMSETLRPLIMAGFVNDGGSIHLHDVTAETLAIVLEYCNKHAAAAAADEVDLASFDRAFIDGFDVETLVDLVHTCGDLEVQGLRALTCDKLADMMKGKTLDEVLEMFELENDSSPVTEWVIQLILEVQELMND